jgi:hypothetical protein
VPPHHRFLCLAPERSAAFTIPSQVWQGLQRDCANVCEEIGASLNCALKALGNKKPAKPQPGGSQLARYGQPEGHPAQGVDEGGDRNPEANGRS